MIARYALININNFSLPEVVSRRSETQQLNLSGWRLQILYKVKAIQILSLYAVVVYITWLHNSFKGKLSVLMIF